MWVMKTQIHQVDRDISSESDTEKPGSLTDSGEDTKVINMKELFF